MTSTSLPEMLLVRQKFPAPPPLEIAAALRRELEGTRVLTDIKRGAQIAVGVGSRGITNLASIVAALINELKGAGAQPFIIPAMGSHGGATPAGQTEILAGYGVTEARMGVPIRAGMEATSLGTTETGIEVNFSQDALQADGVVVVNRIKPHTDFGGSLGSGLVKMMVVGLGKHAGAVSFHSGASRIGFLPALQSMARVILKKAPVLFGVGIIENQRHETARLAVLKASEFEAREPELVAEADRLMARLPFNEIDLLIVDRLGKDISGTGMDSNVIGRGVTGYLSGSRPDSPQPFIRRIFVRDLTADSHGNAIGIGLADFTTTRLVQAIDRRSTFVNALTALSIQAAKIPIHFDTDREAIRRAIGSLALNTTEQARVVRIADTLSLKTLQVSAAFRPLLDERPDLEVLAGPAPMSFDAAGNLS